MLPEFRKIKAEVDKQLYERMGQTMRAELGFFSEVPRFEIHEGDGRWSLRREDGTVDESKLEKISSEVAIKTEDTEKMTLKDSVEKIDSLARDMARKQAQYSFAKIDECLPPSQTIEAKGPLSPEILLTALEKLQIDFDETGKPKLPSLVLAPEPAKQLLAQKEAVEADPVFKRRFNEIIERKREDWRAREADRRLVG